MFKNINDSFSHIHISEIVLTFIIYYRYSDISTEYPSDVVHNSTVHGLLHGVYYTASNSWSVVLRRMYPD